MNERIYCSRIAMAAGEPLAATASHARGCLLISYPKRMWARNALASEGLPASLVAGVEQLAERSDVVTRFVAHEGDWNGRVELSLYPQARRHRDVPLDEVGALLGRARPEDGEPITRPLIAVCTHGVRDRCCALFGGQIAAALRDASAERVEIREATHLGGDRFAPTLVMFPSGDTYGHLTIEDAPSLIDAVLGIGLGPCARFRGSLWREPIDQNADVVARERGGRVVGDIASEERGSRVTLRFEIEVEGRRERVTITCVREERLVVGDCRSGDEGRRGSVRTWRVLRA